AHARGRRDQDSRREWKVALLAAHVGDKHLDELGRRALEGVPGLKVVLGVYVRQVSRSEAWSWVILGPGAVGGSLKSVS
ncbi:MAG TPA: hypothetical protein VK474_00780, partial [Chthoniobacterales bacterium]|nr:hypothetical protein [Chthoniobacterales bacterium]